MIDDRSPRETIQPDDSLSDVGLTRRGFVVTTLAVGFALAVRPLSAETIMVLTSDGALAHYITDPQHKLPKVYLAQVECVPNEEALVELRQGVLLNGKRTRPAEVHLLPDPPNLPDRPVAIRFRKSVSTSWMQITLREGLNRQVRRMARLPCFRSSSTTSVNVVSR